MFTKKSKNKKHSYFMSLALLQAKINLGNTKDNPSVGCVIVKNNSLIGIGSTSINGRPHAEHNAIKFVKTDIKNSELYSTLEPCSNFGKTNPCVRKIINNKIKKVFFAINDPDHKSFNKAHIEFKKKKITSIQGIYKNQIKSFYKSYIKSKNDELPFVSAKIAISKDYYTSNKKKRWITNKYSRGRVHLIRSKHDVILSSAKSVKRDNSKLTCRINGLENTSPTRVILDKNLNINLNSFIIKDAKKNKTIIFFNKIKNKKITILKKNKVQLIRTEINQFEKFNLVDILRKIKNMGYSRIMVEAGVELTNNFMRENLINELYLFVSKNKIYKDGVNSFKKNITKFLRNKKCINEKVYLMGDKFFTYYIK